MTDHQAYVESTSQESLETFDVIAKTASQRLQDVSGDYAQAFASVNTLNDTGAVNNLGKISTSNREGYQALIKEPAISRVVAVDEDGKTRIFYISRKSQIPLEGEIKHASYHSPIGRLASIQVGDEVVISIGGKEQSFELLEKVRYKPENTDSGWDSSPTVFDGSQYGVLTVDSLRGLLKTSDQADAADALAALLLSGDDVKITEGLQHEVRTSMELRDQPILDQFQDEIFRLPLNSQLLILGPPGTGKTTTLIRRLGQKLDLDFLDEPEKAAIEIGGSNALPHEQSWLMFTPTDLLKYFVQEAFNREQIPASKDRIKTWEAYRSNLARSVLGVLQSSTSAGKFVLKDKLNLLEPDVEVDPREWFDAFQSFHKRRIKLELAKGIEILEGLRNTGNSQVIKQLQGVMSGVGGRSLVAVYQNLHEVEAKIQPLIKRLKEHSDKEMRKTLTLTFNKNRRFLHELGEYLDTLQVRDEADNEEEFDDEALVEAATLGSSVQQAEKIYNQTIRSLARTRFLKKKVSKGSRTDVIQQWLADRTPADEILSVIGESIAIQNGLRRFVNASRRYVAEVPASYREFRKASVNNKQWYKTVPENPKHLGSMELDAIVLLILKSSRKLMDQRYISRNIDDSRYTLLKSIASEFRNQVLVDEATDFSIIELACMENLTSLRSRSFFACGDFNQRITSKGMRTESQLGWISKRIKTEKIKTVYRQSRKLNEFSQELLCTQSVISDKAELPKNINHTGFAPVLVEHIESRKQTAYWLSERIKEVEKGVNIGQMPTVAILVNSEDEVKPLANSLNEYLEDFNLRAVACSDGQSLGDGNDVRVFDVQHIKGLEFEAVFFVGLDQLADQLPDLFDKYLYVGATRAATYFGITCYSRMPHKLEALRDRFIQQW